MSTRIIVFSIFLVFPRASELQDLFVKPGEPNEVVEASSTESLIQLMQMHEVIRVEHQVEPLIWDDSLFEIAQERAMLHAKFHGTGTKLEEIDPELAENLHYSSIYQYGGSRELFNSWYYWSAKEYDFDHPTVNSTNRRFAQLVAKTTGSFACSLAFLTNAHYNGSYVLCVYYPKYVPGQERENILRPTNTESIQHLMVENLICPGKWDPLACFWVDMVPQLNHRLLEVFAELNSTSNPWDQEIMTSNL